MHGTTQHVTHDTGRIAYRPAEVADRLGVSRRKVYRLIESGELAAVTVGSRLMVLTTDLDAFVQNLARAGEAA